MFFFFLFPGRYLGFINSIFWDSWVLGDVTFPAETKNKKHTFVKGSAGVHQTRAKFQGLSHKNGVNILTLVR